MNGLLGLAGICTGVYLLFVTLDKIAQMKEEECHHSCDGSCGCCHDADGDRCEGCCCHDKENEEE